MVMGIEVCMEFVFDMFVDYLKTNGSEIEFKIIDDIVMYGSNEDGFVKWGHQNYGELDKNLEMFFFDENFSVFSVVSSLLCPLDDMLPHNFLRLVECLGKPCCLEEIHMKLQLNYGGN
jgi:hypothetical protein